MTFALGQVVITRPALSYAEQHEVDVLALIARHHARDWGDLGPHDKSLNDAALINGARIFSAYDLAGERWYIITEALNDDNVRQSTCVMLSSDY